MKYIFFFILLIGAARAEGTLGVIVNPASDTAKIGYVSVVTNDMMVSCDEQGIQDPEGNYIALPNAPITGVYVLKDNVLYIWQLSLSYNELRTILGTQYQGGTIVGGYSPLIPNKIVRW